ncbi:MAG: phage late control D family protein, partial [Deltaproteobacteria bacterium]|nr:phage late control D family protein [Deltaproteobacteria bacterium]
MPDFIDDALPTDKQLQDMEDSGNSAGDATKDFQDDDQDAKDKAKNVTKGGTEALDKLGDATGIGALKDAADAIDDATDAVWGPDLPLDGNGDPILPPVHIRVYFGEKGMVDSLKDDLIADGLEAADNLVAAGMAEAKSALGKDVPILGELAEDPFTSFLSPKDKDEDESHWIVRAFDLSEGLNETFRLELDLVRIEERSANEPPATATNADGGFIDKIKSAVATGQAMVQQAQGMVQQAQGVVQQLGQVDEVGDLVDIASGLIPGDSGPGTDGPVPQINIPLDPKVFLNQTISVAISRDFGDQSTKNSAPDLYRYPFVKRWITGVITEFEDLGVLRGPASAAVIQAGGLAAEGFARAVHVVVEPSLAKLRLRKNHRIWTDYTALEVVQSVLREASIYGLLPAIPGATLVTDGLTEVVDGIPFAGDALASTASGQKIKFVPPAGVPVTEWTPKREYCVQFGETDLDFVKRLLEEEGITYLFHSSRGEERLVLVDDVSRFPETPTCDGRAVPTAFAFDSQDPHLEHVMAIRQLAKLRPTRVTLRDFNFSNMALRPDRLEKAVTLNPQLPLANPPLPVGPVPPGLVQAPLVPPDPSSGLPGALVGG